MGSIYSIGHGVFDVVDVGNLLVISVFDIIIGVLIYIVSFLSVVHIVIIDVFVNIARYVLVDDVLVV